MAQPVKKQSWDEPVVVTVPESEGPALVELRPSSIAYRLLCRIPGLRRAALTSRLMLALEGSALTSAGYAASQLLKVISTLVLARLLLDPQAFGLMALVNVFLTGLEILSDLGVGLDIVRHPDGGDPVFLDTAFVVQIARSMLLSVLAIGLALPFASFYHQPEVRWLIIVGALSTGIRGFANMSVWVMTRRVETGKLAMLNLIGDAVGVGVSIVWAFVSPTAWALVGGKVAASIAYVIVTHVASGRLQHLRWDPRAARDILVFGSGIFLSSATYFFSSQSERLIVGKFATVAELGCFALAINIAYAPFGVVQRVINTVFYPMISDTARQDESRLAADFRKFRMVFLAASVLMGIGFCTAGPWLVRHVLRPQYAATGWMLQLLGVRSALELFGSAGTAMLLSAGLARSNAVGHVIKFVFLAAGLAVAFAYYGLREAMWVLTVSPCFHYFTILFPLQKRFKFVLRTELFCLTVFLAAVALAALGYRAIAAR